MFFRPTLEDNFLFRGGADAQGVEDCRAVEDVGFELLFENVWDARPAFIPADASALPKRQREYDSFLRR